MRQPRVMPGRGRSLFVESVHSSDEKDIFTVADWLKKPATPATRGEVAAFGKMLIMDEVVPLIRAALEEERSRRWYRRLARSAWARWERVADWIENELESWRRPL